jgi:hypothetical protein
VRQRQLGERLAGPSLPLDIGASSTIPAGIRNLVHLRDRHCRFPGCRRPAAACEVHHIRHKAPDGTTTAWNKDKTRVLHSHSPPARTG